ncbi:MAG: PP2C family protein-serine/threonine phosphatase [Acidobacteriota bacterium]|nr:PP2C family protein-serine/threonine phosphatase [Acidobacteriota bacterium]MDH3523820.1 PP2C family protein-serine/threonine phosphatase [Acidobacteriota bacterium]
MRPRTLLAWLAVGAAALTFLLWALPRLTPFAPERWTLSRDDAEAAALELAEDLGGVPESPFVIVNRSTDERLLYRLSELVNGGGALESVRGSRLIRGLRYWRVSIYDPDDTDGSWSHQVSLSPTGQLLQLERRIDEDEELGALSPEDARARAERLLAELGFDLAAYGEPVVRAQDRDQRTDLELRYSDGERLLGERFDYGLDVKFAGDRLVGFSGFFDDPDEDSLTSRLQPIGLWQFAWIYVGMLLTPLAAIPFVRRYHAGEVGVRRGLQIAAVMAIAGFLSVVFTAAGTSASWSFGILSKPQTAVVVVFLFSVTFYMPLAALGFLGWTVGESICRERWGRKLAGFDALFRGQWRNATFARASLRGLICGLLILAVAFAFLILRPRGVFMFDLVEGAPSWGSTEWWGLPVFCTGLLYALYVALFGQLFLVPWLASLFGRSGRWLGPLAALLIAAALFFPPAILLPTVWTFAVSLVFYGVAMLVFLRYGVFASFVALFTANVLPVAIPLVGAGHPTIELNAALLLLAAALPALLSFRYLFGGRELVYRWEDVPPHVRRIAERERHKVELETARGIQSSILPDLPPELNGVQLSHRYLPATEVGGDFYDVLALDDGRLAVAVGDVAGHGVSSGLVMSMAKSALAVQVTFDPEVQAVFRTLNRMVFQSARRRLLTTLCYALVDPRSLELDFASAGHLFPYRVSRGGRVEALESVSYPLGVRDTIEIRTRVAKLEPGDKLFLYSDGVVESTPDGGSEPFGFGRLEESLRRHAGRGVHGLRDGVLGDLEAFVGTRPLEDDLTVLVLEMPAAAA